MKFLELTRSGSSREWAEIEPWQDGFWYLIGCDPALGRIGQGGDHSCIHVAKRLPGRRLRQVGEFYARWPIGRIGEAIACLARRYHDPMGRPAMVNIERNIVDAALVAMQYQKFPEECLFVPRRLKSLGGAPEQNYFFQKTASNSRFLVDTFHEYWDRQAVEITIEETLADLASLERTERGDVITRGKDRATAAMMVTIMDQDLDAVVEEVIGPVETKDPPWGVDAKLWREMKGIPEPGTEKGLPGPGVWEKTAGIGR